MKYWWDNWTKLINSSQLTITFILVYQSLRQILYMLLSLIKPNWEMCLSSLSYFSRPFRNQFNYKRSKLCTLYLCLFLCPHFSPQGRTWTNLGGHDDKATDGPSDGQRDESAQRRQKQHSCFRHVSETFQEGLDSESSSIYSRWRKVLS